MIDPTDISAYGCYKRACCLRQDAGHRGSPLLRYAALEARFSIERYLWETLDHLNPEMRPKRKRKLWSVGQLEAAILNEDPDFIHKLNFLNLLIRAQLIPPPPRSLLIAIPNLADFNAQYGRLGNFLHAPKNGEMIAVETVWWTQLDELIATTLKFLEPYVHGSMVKFEVSDRMRPVFEDFKNATQSADQALVALKAFR